MMLRTKASIQREYEYVLKQNADTPKWAQFASSELGRFMLAELKKRRDFIMGCYSMIEKNDIALQVLADIQGSQKEIDRLISRIEDAESIKKEIDKLSQMLESEIRKGEIMSKPDTSDGILSREVTDKGDRQ